MSRRERRRIQRRERRERERRERQHHQHHQPQGADSTFVEGCLYYAPDLVVQLFLLLLRGIWFLIRSVLEWFRQSP